MKMSGLKRIVAVGLVVFLGTSVSGCGSSSGGSGEKVVLKAGFSTGESDPRVVATQMFKEEVEKGTEGRVTIEIHADGELGSDADLISSIVNDDGKVDITASSAGNFSSYSANVGISALPFLFENFEKAWEFVDGDVEKQAEQELEDYNIKVLGHYDNGFRCVTTSNKAVNSVADMDGLVIRIPENQVVMQTMLALGAKPKVLEFTELYDALKKGDFDAQENPVPVILNNNLYEVQKYLSITNHSYDVMLFVIGQDDWDDISEEDQKVMEEAIKKAQEENRKLVKKQTEDYIKELENKGMTVTNPDLAEFKEATKDVADTFKGTFDEDLLSKVK